MGVRQAKSRSLTIVSCHSPVHQWYLNLLDNSEAEDMGKKGPVGGKEAMIYGQTVPRDLLKLASSEPENQPLHQKTKVCGTTSH